MLTKTALLKSRVAGLHQAGVSLAIDNFGHGNSSFGLFKELPFSEVKIDRSFVKNCSVDKGNANICKSMVALAHNFGSKASAVGVETGEEAGKLAEIGCDSGQGYLFAKPMTEQELMAMVMAARGAPHAIPQPSNCASAERATPA